MKTARFWLKVVIVSLECLGAVNILTDLYVLARRNTGAIVVQQAVRQSATGLEYFGWISNNIVVDEARLRDGAQLASCCEIWRKDSSNSRWTAIGIIGEDLNRSRDALAAAYRENPTHPMLQLFRIRNFEQLAQRALIKNDLISAINYMHQSDQIAPVIAYRHKKLYQSFCIDWYQQGLWREAKAACERLLDQSAQRDMFLLLAQIDFQLGDLVSARRQFELLEAQYPDWRQPREWLGKIERLETGP